MTRSRIFWFFFCLEFGTFVVRFVFIAHGIQRQVFKVDPKKLDLDLSNLVKIEFYVSEVLEEFEFTLNDLSHIANRSGKIDRTVLQFIDIATSQTVVMYP